MTGDDEIPRLRRTYRYEVRVTGVGREVSILFTNEIATDDSTLTLDPVEIVNNHRLYTLKDETRIYPLARVVEIKLRGNNPERSQATASGRRRGDR